MTNSHGEIDHFTVFTHLSIKSLYLYALVQLKECRYDSHTWNNQQTKHVITTNSHTQALCTTDNDKIV